MFSANSSISSTGLKPLDEAKGKGKTESDCRGTGSDWQRTGSDWRGMGSD